MENSIINKYLSVINNPNEEGLDCDFDTLSISLGGNSVVFGLPNMPNYNLGALAGSECDTLGTAIQEEQLPLKNEFTIYPNPAKIFFSIKLNATHQEPFTLMIDDVLGRNVLYLSKAMSDVQIDVSMLRTGIYMVHIKSKGNELISGKLTVTR
jgi:hypothetical protein